MPSSVVIVAPFGTSSITWGNGPVTPPVAPPPPPPPPPSRALRFNVAANSQYIAVIVAASVDI